MIRGKGFKDVPGVKYKVIRGKLGVSVAETFRRIRSRSKYNLKRDAQSVY
jgi:ribosomal protein S12